MATVSQKPDQSWPRRVKTMPATNSRGIARLGVSGVNSSWNGQAAVVPLRDQVVVVDDLAS